jgi:tetratricopeptide (TPR) repeat protein
VTLTAALSPLTAQRDKQEPKRPQMPAEADTNDAYAYYNFGLQVIERDPRKAADAFYWATRLDPMMADAFYARRAALLLQDKRRLDRYFDGDKRTVQSPEVQRIDSLYYHALTLNPFLYRKLERVLSQALLQQYSDDIARQYNVSSGEVRFYLDRLLMEAPPATRAWRAYGEARFPEALRLYADAIKQAKHKAWLRADRGRLFFQIGQVDSALVELTQAIEEMRKEDAKDLVYVYESKALMEQSIAMAHLRLGNTQAAREAFGRALQEDMAYFPAHMQLGYLALDSKDTATAVSEMDLAVQIRGDDPGLRYTYGFILGMIGKHKEAEEQLRKAAELNPAYAAPHYGLGKVLDAQQRSADALQEYRTFLALAARSDLRRPEVEARVKVLASNGGN